MHLKLAQLHELVKNHIRKAETHVIFVDEFQHLYEEKKKGVVTNQVIINQLKLLMEEARVAIIPVGVLSVETFLSLDAQLAGRCPVHEYSRLDAWEFPDLNEGIDLEKEIRRVQKANPSSRRSRSRRRPSSGLQNCRRETRGSGRDSGIC